MDRELYDLLSKLHLIPIIDHPFLSFFVLVLLIWLFTIIRLVKKHNKINDYSVDLVDEVYPVKDNELKLEASIVNIISNISNNRTHYYPEIVYYIDNQEFKQILNYEIPIRPEYEGIKLYRKTNLMLQKGDKIEIRVNRYNLNDVYSPTLLNPEISKYTRNREDLYPEVSDNLGKKILLSTISFIISLFSIILVIVANILL